ncbi:MAG: DNA polymerase III subunit [Ruminococcus sp.]|nr:DNA polymerase III subunit [Candidatus Apopatosoma intestinale]
MNQTSYFYGNSAGKEFFGAAIRNGKVPHAYLLEGAKGSGKKTFVRYICSLLACSESMENRPCEHCDNCRAIGRGTCPDIAYLNRREDKKTIGVEEVRDLFSTVSLSPSVLDFKAYVIDGADDLTVSSQNALLKVIEEPPQNTYIFLLCENADHLIPTVLSRVQKFSMEVFEAGEVERFLREIPDFSADEDILSFAVRNSLGSIGKAIMLLTEKTLDRDAVSIAHAVLDGQIRKNGEVSYHDFLQIFATKMTGRDLFVKVCECLQRGYGDVLAYSVRESDRVEFLEWEDMPRISSGIAASSAITCIEAIAKAVSEQSANTNLSLSALALAIALWNAV